MRIRILGIGGFVNPGLPYNSFMVDDDFLVETPPDIMVSLKRQDISVEAIKRIYLSHFHGDHCFGFPFFTLNLMKWYLRENREPETITVYGPAGIKERMKALQALAISADNPSVRWIDTAFDFHEIDESSIVHLDADRSMVFHRMIHELETYGFSLCCADRYDLSYLPDTTWDPSFAGILGHKPKMILCDLNGMPHDTVKVHMSERDIVDHAIPVTGTSTRYIGIHVSQERVSGHQCLEYAKVADVYET